MPDVSVAARNSSAQTSAVTNHVIALPDGSNNVGQLVVARLAINSTGGGTNWGALGWTLIEAGSSALDRLDWYGRIIDGTEGFDGVGDTITVTTAVAHRSCHRTWRVIDFDPATWPEGLAATGNSTGPNPPNLNPSWGSEPTLYLVGHVCDSGRTTTGFPAGYTDTLSQTSGGTSGAHIGAGAAERILTADSEDPAAFALSGAAVDWRASTIAIRSAPAGGGPTPKFVPWIAEEMA